MGQFALAFTTNVAEDTLEAWEFWPAPAGELYIGDMALYTQIGNTCTKNRENRGDIWSPPYDRKHSVRYGDWLNEVEAQGACYVKIYDVDDQGKPVKEVIL